jgi:hypothetical protein
MSMPDVSVLATVASVIAAFGVTMLFFRVQREVAMQSAGERNWIPAADWLLISATLVALLLVLLPMVLASSSRLWGRRIPTAACAALLVAVSSYVPALLAHYRLIFGAGRSGARRNPEPAELAVIATAGAVAVAVFIASLVSNS